MNKEEWHKESEWERKWWDGSFNTYNEETKQYIYAHYMGLDRYATNWYGRRGWDMGDKNIMDIGGGPVSMMLKTKAPLKIVVDPCDYSKWVEARYEEADIKYYKQFGEECNEIVSKVDEVWIYNVLQHTLDPMKIIQNAKKISKTIRLFEWIDAGTSDGHPHELTADKLDAWLDGVGQVKQLTQSPCTGKAYYGIFKGDL